jgi:hypothetical protein
MSIRSTSACRREGALMNGSGCRFVLVEEQVRYSRDDRAIACYVGEESDQRTKVLAIARRRKARYAAAAGCCSPTAEVGIASTGSGAGRRRAHLPGRGLGRDRLD